MQEIEALSAEERKELEASMQPASVRESGATYLDREAAKPMIKEMLGEHSELFRKLAQ
jgi:hypothetical protein